MNFKMGLMSQIMSASISTSKTKFRISHFYETLDFIFLENITFNSEIFIGRISISPFITPSIVLRIVFVSLEFFFWLAWYKMCVVKTSEI